MGKYQNWRMGRNIAAAFDINSQTGDVAVAGCLVGTEYEKTSRKKSREARWALEAATGISERGG
jgi:hypothetical protein